MVHDSLLSLPIQIEEVILPNWSQRSCTGIAWEQSKEIWQNFSCSLCEDMTWKEWSLSFLLVQEKSWLMLHLQ